MSDSSYEMLVRDTFRPAEISVSHQPVEPPRSADLAAHVDANWRARKAAAASAGVTLTNGHLLRLASFEARPQHLSLELGNTRYADFLATNADAPTRAALPWQQLANPLGTSALILTADGHCVLGLRGGAVLLHQGYVHTIGGMFEAEDLIDGHVHATGSILREAREELGIEDAQVTTVRCRGLMRDTENLQPELMFELSVDLDTETLERHWQTAPSRHEHVSLVSIPGDPKSLRAYLTEGHPLAPQARAALELRLAP